MPKKLGSIIGTVIAGALAFLLAAASNDLGASEGKLTLEQLLAKTSVRVRDVRNLNLEVKTGDGPVLWAALDEKHVVWFWCRPGVSSAIGLGKVILIATGEANDENHATIIWPHDKVGHDYGKELDALYNGK